MRFRLTRSAAAEWSTIAATWVAFGGAAWAWIDPPRRWPGIRVLEYIGPGLIGLAILLFGCAILNGLRRLTGLERAWDAERDTRSKQFEEWLAARAQAADDDYKRRFSVLAHDVVNARAALQRDLDNFYKAYDGRLRDVETLSEEGPWVTVQAGPWTVKLTDLAHKEYLAWDNDTQASIIEGLKQSIGWGNGSRFHKRNIQYAAGEIYALEKTEYFWDDVAALSEAAREALLKPEPAFRRWFNDHAMKRRRKRGPNGEL